MDKKEIMRNWLLKLLAGKKVVIINFKIEQIENNINITLNDDAYLCNVVIDIPFSHVRFLDSNGFEYSRFDGVEYV